MRLANNTKYYTVRTDRNRAGNSLFNLAYLAENSFHYLIRCLSCKVRSTVCRFSGENKQAKMLR
jgi:hypothetical protein